MMPSRARQGEAVAAEMVGQDVADRRDAGVCVPGLLGADEDARRARCHGASLVENQNVQPFSVLAAHCCGRGTRDIRAVPG